MKMHVHASQRYNVKFSALTANLTLFQVVDALVKNSTKAYSSMISDQDVESHRIHLWLIVSQDQISVKLGLDSTKSHVLASSMPNANVSVLEANLTHLKPVNVSAKKNMT